MKLMSIVCKECYGLFEPKAEDLPVCPDCEHRKSAVKKWIDIDTATKIINISKPILLSLLNSGEIPHLIVGTHISLDEHDVDNLRIRFLPTIDDIRKQTDPIIKSVRRIYFGPLLRPGIYFLCSGKEIVYIGKSSKLLMRICNHIQENEKKFDTDRIYFFNCQENLLCQTERALIAKHKPRFNITNKGEDFVKEA